jgi:hypothetical protein
VRLLKRAQIFVADLWAAFEGEGYGEFIDIDKVTMFAGLLWFKIRIGMEIDASRLSCATDITHIGLHIVQSTSREEDKRIPAD